MVKKVKISEILKTMAEEDAVLIDVTDQQSYEKVHIPNAINIPYDEISTEICRKIDPSNPVITCSKDYFCPHAKLAAQKLKLLGFSKAYYYQGGKKEWMQARMPVEGLILKTSVS